jgi:hypothetical protein
LLSFQGPGLSRNLYRRITELYAMSILGRVEYVAGLLYVTFVIGLFISVIYTEGYQVLEFTTYAAYKYTLYLFVTISIGVFYAFVLFFRNLIRLSTPEIQVPSILSVIGSPLYIVSYFGLMYALGFTTIIGLVELFATFLFIGGLFMISTALSKTVMVYTNGYYT